MWLAQFCYTDDPFDIRAMPQLSLLWHLKGACVVDVDGLGLMLILDGPLLKQKAVHLQITFSEIKFHLYVLFFKFTWRECIFCKFSAIKHQILFQCSSLINLYVKL